MEAQDFEMSSPKRQKTDSPVATEPPLAFADDNTTTTVEDAKTIAQTDGNSAPVPAQQPLQPGFAPTSTDQTQGADMLDMLMEHVETEAAFRSAQAPNETQVLQPAEQPEAQVGITKEVQDVGMGESEAQDGAQVQAQPVAAQDQQETDSAPVVTSTIAPARDGPNEDKNTLPTGLKATSEPTAEYLRAVAEVNGLPPTADTLAQDAIRPVTAGTEATATEPTTAPEVREWETDSSPYDSDSSDTTSTDSSDSSSDDDEDDYQLLDPYEQARILMAEEGGGSGGGGDSDDEGHPNNRTPKQAAGAGLRTQNEAIEPAPPKPNVTITEDMKVTELGVVEAIVEHTVLIRGTTSGEYRVLESNSLLCTSNRTVIGVVSEALGRVEQPLYTVRFASDADIIEAGIKERGTKIYYVDQHSMFVFTQPLKAVKGSDASNFHDEEVGDDEMEFSDDEAEAEHKRLLKMKRKGIDPTTAPPAGGRGRGAGRGRRGGLGGGQGRGGHMQSIPESAMDHQGYANGTIEMNYDDVEEDEADANGTGEVEYTCLKRPETMPPSNGNINNGMPPMFLPTNQNQQHRQNNQDSRGRGRGRGRGNFNNNRGGRGRGGQQNNQNYNQNHNQNRQNNYAVPSQKNSYTPSSTHSLYNSQNQFQPQQQQFSYPPQTNFSFPAPPPPPQLIPTTQPYQNTNTFSPSPITPLPVGTGSFNFPQMQQQYFQNMQYMAQAQGQQSNAGAIAQVQRQLEEFRRAAGGGSGNANNGWNGGRQGQ